MPPRVIRFRPAAGAAIVVAAVLVLAYTPVALFSFGFHNDYWAWGFDASWCCGPHPEAAITAAIGRILAAKLLTAQFLFIHSLDDLRLWRVITVLTLALNALYFLYLIRREAPASGLAVAAAVTVLVFLHTTMQLNVLWASNLVYFNLPILLALIGAHLLLLARERHDRPAAAAGRYVLALPPLIAALFIYPPTATFLIIPPLYGLLMRPPVLSRHIVSAALLAVVLVAGFGLYAFIHRVLLLPSLPDDVSMSTYRWELPPLPVRTALSRLLRIYLPDAGNAWSIWDSHLPGMVLMGVIAAGSLAAVLGNLRQGRMRDALATLVVVGSLFGLMALAILPNLVAAQLATTVRVLFVPGACLVIGFVWAITRLLPPRHAPVLLAVLAACAGCLACANVWSTAAVASREHEAIGQGLAALDATQRRSIVVLRSDAARQFLGLDVNEAFRPLPPIVPIADYFLGRRHRGDAAFDLGIVSTRPGQPPIFVEAGTGVVDIQAMLEDETRARPVVFGRIAGTLTVRPEGAAKGVADAFDGAGGTFWEAWTTPFPISVQIELAAPQTVVAYSLSSGVHDRSDRMPTGWRLLARGADGAWVEIDRQGGLVWRDGEAKRFSPGTAGPWRGLRFEFMANGLPPGGTQGVRIYEIGLH